MRFKILFFVLVTFYAFAQTNLNKKAILIGIGDYPKNSALETLAGNTDVDFMKTILIKQGFQNDNFTILKDKDANRENIRSSIKTFAAKPGDIVVVFFSGHGKQVTDLNHDEKEDGLDEAIICYDNQLIIDDEINQMLESLQSKVGNSGQVILFLNSCHSGSGTKGVNNEIVRLKYVDSPNNLQRKGKLIAIESCSPRNKTNFIRTPENRSIGPLTYALGAAFESIERDETYNSYFRRVKAIMSEKANFQIPFKEGDGLNERVFNGDVVETDIIYRISEVVGNKVKILGNYFNSVLVGSTVSFSKIIGKGVEGQQKIATGKVLYSDPFVTEIEILEGKLPDIITNLNINISEGIIINNNVNLTINKNVGKVLQEILVQILKANAKFNLTAINPDFEISEDEKGINLFSTNGHHIKASLNKDGISKEQILEKLNQLVTAKFLIDLKVSNKNFEVEINLRHSNNLKLEENGETIWKPSFYEGAFEENMPVFNANETSWFTIKNIGAKSLYFTLIDIQPDGVINVLLPDQQKKWDYEDLKLEPGESKGFSFGSPSEPFGIECFKVILSQDVEDYSFLQSNLPFQNDRIDLNESSLVSFLKNYNATNSQTLERKIHFNGATKELFFKIIP